MTDITKALETLALKSKFIADAKNNKDIATARVDAATDQAIVAAIALGEACNGELPDKRVLKKRFPDAVKWDDVQANLLTYARLIMQGEGATVTVGRGEAETTFTVNRATITNAPCKLSTVAVALRKLNEQQEVIYDQAALALHIEGTLGTAFASPEHIRAQADSELARKAASLPYSEEVVEAWEAAVAEVGPEALARQAAQVEAEKVFKAMKGLSNEAYTILAGMLEQDNLATVEAQAA